MILYTYETCHVLSLTFKYTMYDTIYNKAEKNICKVSRKVHTSGKRRDETIV